MFSCRIGGKYSYVDGAVAPGVWVYRIQEEVRDDAYADKRRSFICARALTKRHFRDGGTRIWFVSVTNACLHMCVRARERER